MCVAGRSENELSCNEEIRIVKELETVLENGLVCSVDWLAFTVLDKTYYSETKNEDGYEIAIQDIRDITIDDCEKVLETFGFDTSEFQDCGHGGMGYSKMFKYIKGGIKIYCAGARGMGVHVDVSGSGITTFMEHFRNTCIIETLSGEKELNVEAYTLKGLFECITSIGKVTRIDLAIDNMHDLYYTVSEIEDIFRDKERHISKFRKGYGMKSYSGNGHTAYMGSGNSDVMLRVYDKQAEQNEKNNGTVIEHPWVRWELEIKHKKAEKLCEHIADGKTVPELCFGVLSNYIRVIVPDNNNKSRCTTDVKWEKFLHNVEKLSLHIPYRKKTLGEKMTWFSRQCGPILAGIIDAHDGDMSFVYDNIPEWHKRMNPNLQEVVAVEKVWLREEVERLNDEYELRKKEYEECLKRKEEHEKAVSQENASVQIESTLTPSQRAVTEALNRCMRTLKVTDLNMISYLISCGRNDEERIDLCNKLCDDEVFRARWMSASVKELPKYLEKQEKWKAEILEDLRRKGIRTH